MPELPEVETIKNELLPYVIGRTITGVTLFWDRIVRTPSAAEFTEEIIGQDITALTRRGKYLFFHLSNGRLLVMHMKMTGSLIINPRQGNEVAADRLFSRAAHRERVGLIRVARVCCRCPQRHERGRIGID